MCRSLPGVWSGPPVHAQLLERVCAVSRADCISRAADGASAVPTAHCDGGAGWVDRADYHPLCVGAVGPGLLLGVPKSEVAGAPDLAPSRSLHEGHCGNYGSPLHPQGAHAWSDTAHLHAGDRLFCWMWHKFSGLMHQL